MNVYDSVKRFLQTNKILLDKDIVEFFHSAYNGLSSKEQAQLVDILDDAGIDTYSARERVLRFIISMDTEVLLQKLRLRTFVSKFIGEPLGFNENDIVDYIIQNTDEWDVKIFEGPSGVWYIVPKDL